MKRRAGVYFPHLDLDLSSAMLVLDDPIYFVFVFLPQMWRGGFSYVTCMGGHGETNRAEGWGG